MHDTKSPRTPPRLAPNTFDIFRLSSQIECLDEGHSDSLSLLSKTRSVTATAAESSPERGLGYVGQCVLSAYVVV